MAARNNKHYCQQRTRSVSTASVAREIAGFTVAEAASRARIGAAYLRQVERQGWAPYGLACRLSRIYGCSLLAFLNSRFEGR